MSEPILCHVSHTVSLGYLCLHWTVSVEIGCAEQGRHFQAADLHWTVELGCAAQGYHSQAADFLSRSENRSGWKTFSPAVQMMAAGCKIRSTSQIYAQLQL